MAKSPKKSKTILFNTLGLLVEMLIVAVTKDIIPIPVEYQVLTLLALNALMNNVLRFATREGVNLPFKKKEIKKLS